MTAPANEWATVPFTEVARVRPEPADALGPEPGRASWDGGR